MGLQERTQTEAHDGKYMTTYHERKIGKTVFRITSVYRGEIELSKALEDLTVRKILHAENTCGAISAS